MSQFKPVIILRDLTRSSLIQCVLGILVIAALFTSCSGKEMDPIPKGIPIIDISNGFNEGREVKLSDVAESVDYIKLESREDCYLTGIRYIEFIGSNIFIVDRRTPQVFCFDTSGKFIRQIGTQGKGPGEYIDVNSFTVTRNTDSLIVLHDAEQGRLLFYNMNGEFIRGITLRDWPTTMQYLDEHLFLAYAHPLFARLDNKSVQVFNLNGEKVNSMVDHSHENVSKDESYHMTTYSSVRLQPLHDTLVYWDYKYRTIWGITSAKKVYPRFAIDFDFRIPYDLLYNQIRGEYAFFLDYMETDKYIFFNQAFSKSFEIPRPITIVFDKTSMECYNLNTNLERYNTGFINDWDGGWPFIPEKITQKGKLVSWIQPFRFKEFLNADGYKDIEAKYPDEKDHLHKLIQDSDISDNPIIMLVKLKD